MIKVSVLTYVKNDVAHIERCMRSVMAQDLQEMEYLVIDGGSTDGTREIINRLSVEDDRIRIIDTDPGLGHQFNVGVKAARGDYIGVCESDDYLLPGMYRYQYRIAHDNDVDILRADAYDFFIVGDEEKRICFSLPGVMGLKNRLLSDGDEKQAIRMGVNRFFSGLYRRRFIIDNDLFMNETPGAAYQDNTFAFLTLINAKRVFISDHPFYCYKLDNPNASCNSPEHLNMVDEEYKLLQERLRSKGEWENHKETYVSWLIMNHLWFCNLLNDDGLRNQEIDIFYKSLKEIVDIEKLAEDKLRQQDVVFIHAIQSSEEDFKGLVFETYRKIDKARSDIFSISSEERVIIFGAGNIGKVLLCVLLGKGADVVCFTDNDKRLWGSEIEGITVKEPGKVFTTEKDARVVVANVEHNMEIREQLKGYGIMDEQLIICDSYDFTVRKILMGSLIA